ncbi:MAG: GMC family oxidoreductase [Candidatus Binatia bacterium]
MAASWPDPVVVPPGDVRCDVAVIGSGPGGAVTACTLAEAGRDVVLIEEGPLLALEATPAFSALEMRAKYRNGGITVALGAPGVNYAEGRCVGGGSEVNSGLYHRTPPDVLERWRGGFGLEHATADEMAPHFATCEQDVSVSHLPGPAPAASLRLHEGAERLGWSSIEVPRWYRYAPDGSGDGVKQSMTRTYVPRATSAGCRLVTDTRVLRLGHEDGRWTLRCVPSRMDAATRRRAFTVRARTVFVAAGAFQTPALLLRSGIKHNVGRSLHLHPTVKVVARFDEVVNAAGMGVPVHQVKEFAPHLSFGCSISQPPHLALAMTDHPERIPEVHAEWPHMAVYYAMSDGGAGRVRTVPGFHDPLVSFALDDADLTLLADGLAKLCRCLLAAGATVLYPSVRGCPAIRSEADLALLPAILPRDRTSLMTIHAFSTCPMGQDRGRTVADSFGRVHEAIGLHIADASLLCGPPGVNPQGSIMAFARRNALAFLDLA